MRAIRSLGVTVCLALATACQSPLQRSDGEASAVGSAKPLSPQVSTSPSAGPAATASSGEPAVSASSPSSPARTATTLGPDGVGALKLGMTRTQAEATGLVAPFKNEPNSDVCLWRSRLVGAGLAGAPDAGGLVLHSERLGVATIDAYAGMKTPEGIGLGSSVAAVGRAYPGFTVTTGLGRGYAKVPGNSKAVYRIGVNNGVVDELTLQFSDQDCYE